MYKLPSINLPNSPTEMLGGVLGILLLLVVCGDRVTAQTRPAPSVTQTPADPTSSRAIYERPAFTRAVQANTRTRTGRPGPEYWQQYARYDIEARFDPGTNRLHGSEQVIYLNRSPDTLQRVAVHLRQNLFKGALAQRAGVPTTGGVSLTQVRVGDTSLTHSPHDTSTGYSVDRTVAWLHLPNPLPPNDSVSLGFEWAYTPPPAPADGRQGREGNVYFFGYWYPQVAVYDDVDGWVAEPYTGQAEFYMGQADYDVRLTVPTNWLVGATGQLQNSSTVLSPRLQRRLERARTTDAVVSILAADERDTVRATRPTGERSNTTTWHFTAHSVRDFAWGLSNEYVWEATQALLPSVEQGKPQLASQTRAQPRDTVLIHSFFRPTKAAAAWSQKGAHYTRDAVEVLSESLRPYPYPTMTSMEGVLQSGGMEYPMVTIMQPWADSLKLAGDLMHEVGHMWIPMEVGTNEKRNVWMDEGLTQFNTAQGMRRRFGPEPRPGGRPNDSEMGHRQTYLRIARRGYEVPLMQHGDRFPASLYFDLPYDKAAQVISALRGLLGEDTFERAYRTFFNRWWGKHPTPYDFFNTIADVSGRDLTWFWHAWMSTTGTLDQAVSSVTVDDDSTLITVTNKGRVPMPVPLLLTREDGSTTRKTIPVRVWLNGASQHRISVSNTPPISRIEIDPERRFPDLDRSNQIWRRTH